MAQKLMLPQFKSRLTASYKNSTYRATYGFPHYGIDLVYPGGSDKRIFASGTGTLIAKGWDENTGYTVVIKYPAAYNHKSKTYEDVIFRYFHLNSINSNLPTGTNAIEPLTFIGYYGGSGNGVMNALDPHLHLEADTDTSYPCYSPTFRASGSIIKGAVDGATDSTLHSALEYLHCKTSSPENQEYDTVNDSYINSGDYSLPSI